MCYGELQSAMMQKARKLHQCDHCHRPIQPGDLYERSTGLYEGDWYRNAYHTNCAAEMNALWKEHGNDMCYIDIREAAREEASGNGWRAFRAKVQAAKQRLLDSHATRLEQRKLDRARRREEIDVKSPPSDAGGKA